MVKMTTKYDDNNNDEETNTKTRKVRGCDGEGEKETGARS